MNCRITDFRGTVRQNHDGGNGGIYSSDVTQPEVIEPEEPCLKKGVEDLGWNLGSPIRIQSKQCSCINEQEKKKKLNFFSQQVNISWLFLCVDFNTLSLISSSAPSVL